MIDEVGSTLFMRKSSCAGSFLRWFSVDVAGINEERGKDGAATKVRLAHRLLILEEVWRYQ